MVDDSRFFKCDACRRYWPYHLYQSSRCRDCGADSVHLWTTAGRLQPLLEWIKEHARGDIHAITRRVLLAAEHLLYSKVDDTTRQRIRSHVRVALSLEHSNGTLFHVPPDIHVEIEHDRAILFAVTPAKP
jgi:hypothetical protein